MVRGNPWGVIILFIYFWTTNRVMDLVKYSDGCRAVQ